MKYSLTILALLTVSWWLPGCASVTTQIDPSKEHGLLCFASPNANASAYRAVQRVDGKRIKHGTETTYRVAPGRHEIVFEDVRMEVQDYSYRVPRIGVGMGNTSSQENATNLEFSPDGLSPDSFQRSPSDLSVGSRPLGTIHSRGEQRVSTMMTNRVDVKAGWEYWLDGDSVQERRRNAGEEWRRSQAADRLDAPPGPSPPESEILVAIREGDHDAVRRLLVEHPSLLSHRTASPLSPVHYAAQYGHVEMLKEFIRHGASMDEKDEQLGSTPLMSAAIHGHPDVVLLLLENGAQIWTHNRLGNTPMDSVAHGWRLAGEDDSPRPEDLESRLMACMKHLLDHGADPNDVSGIMGVTSLQNAAFAEACFLIPLLVEHGAKVDALDRDKATTALQTAALVGSEACARALLDCGASVSATGAERRNPLHAAVISGQAAMVDFLLGRDAPVNRGDQSGQTALHLAVKADWSKQTVSSVLFSFMNELMAGQEHPLPNDRSEQLLAAALDLRMGSHPTDYPETVDRLIRGGADVDRTDAAGRTPLMAAVFAGNSQAVAQLLNHGADMEISDQQGFTPLLTAIEFGAVEIFTNLVAQGANVNVRAADDRSAAHLAAQHGNLAALEVILGSNMDLDSVDNTGRTTLLYAAFHGRPEIVDILVDRGAVLEICDSRDRWTPLLGAIEGAKLKTASLQARRADAFPDAVRNMGSLKDYCEVVRHLVEAGADVEAKNAKGLTVLQQALAYGLIDLVTVIQSAQA